MHQQGPAPPIVQVVPPGPGGVRDYALALQAQWAACGERSVLLDGVPAADEGGPHGLISSAIGTPMRRDAPLPVLLHFSGYGYARRGLCFWLVHELRHARAQLGAQLRLGLFFHELYASGPPWRSAFWLSGLQQRIAADLARQADAIWTNSTAHAAWLRGVRGAAPLCGIEPVFSNVGEPLDPSAPSTRAPHAILFGAAETRQRVLTVLRHHPGHGARLRALGIESVIEVGGGVTDATGLELPHHARGRLDGAALTDALLAARWGLLDYPTALLGKSGVFAAYAAHGLAVLNTRPRGDDADGLRVGIDHLDARTWLRAPANPVRPQADDLGAALHTWYADHRLADQATRLLAGALDHRTRDNPARQCGTGHSDPD